MTTRFERCAALSAWLPLAACAGTTSPGTPDGAAPGGDGPAADASVPLTPLEKACTPEVELKLTDTDTTRQRLFLDVSGDDPEAFMQEIGRGVCRILYRKPEEVRDATKLTLIIEHAVGDVAWKGGDGAQIEVGISTDHLSNVKNQGRQVAMEIKGILYHEMTHMYQHDDSDQGGVDGGLIEGIADSVRIRAGFTPNGAQPDKGGNWDDGYTTTAFFLNWVEDHYPDFVYKLNLTMDERDGKKWTPEAFKTITGKTVEQLWADYIKP